MVTFETTNAAPAARPPDAGPMTYSEYLCLDTLLDCQQPVTNEPSERLFIVFHQTSELWFAAELDALDRARDAMLAGQLHPALDALRLATGITQQLTVSLGWLDDHLSPQAFANFRVALGTASGLQSAQFREIEYLSGHKDHRFLAAKGLAAPDRDRLTRRLADPSLWDAFCTVLAQRGLPNAGQGLTATLNALLSPGARLDLNQLAEALIDHDQPNAGQGLTATLKLLSSPGSCVDLYQLAEALIDHDQAWADWRARHASMVARHLGTQHGTGGTSGATYLHARATVEFFPQLWAARYLERTDPQHITASSRTDP